MLDPDSAAFIQTGVSISLAACGPDRLPSMARGYGCKLVDGGSRVAIFLKASQSVELLANIRHSGRVANVFSQPSSNRTIQLKGIDACVQPFDPADLAVIENHVRDFVGEVVPLGLTEALIRALFDYAADDLATVVYTPTAGFSQTPGPKAGEALESAR